MTIPKLKGNLTQIFNKYIRLRDVNDEGYGSCISCGNTVQYKHPNYQAGHYYPAPVELLRFHEFNVNGQCKACNHFKSGNLIEYRKGLLKKIGEDGVKELDTISEIYKSKGHKWDRFTLEYKIAEYKDKINKLSKSKMFKP